LPRSAWSVCSPPAWRVGPNVTTTYAELRFRSVPRRSGHLRGPIAPLEPRFLEVTARLSAGNASDRPHTAPAIARSAANSPPLLLQAGRRGGRSPAQKPIFFAFCRDEPSTVITRGVARGAGGALCCDDGGRHQLLPVSAETSPRSLSTRIPESNTTRPGRYCFASLRDGALCLIGF
jgi:hypothetical protein